MELVNLVYSRSTSVSDPIDACDFFNEWIVLLANAGFYNDGSDSSTVDQKVAGKMNMNHLSKEYFDLKELCSEKYLKCDGVQPELLCRQYSRTKNRNKAQSDMEVEEEEEEEETVTSETDNSQEELSTINIQKKEVQKRRADSSYRFSMRNNWRLVYCPEQSALIPIPNKADFHTKLLQQSMVFTVQIFRPVTNSDEGRQRKTSNVSRKLDHVIAVLGEQPLTALRDKIVCTSDHVILGEYSISPEALVSGQTAKDVYKSAFFYIGDTFYNDLRYDDCTDYSRNLIEYASQSSQQLGPFHSKSMENVRFRDLRIQLGYPYLYLHQGNCEHIIIFSDLRLLSPEESHLEEDYPVICRDAPRRRVACMICETFTARWVTRGNKRLSQDPYFFCDECFYKFNYTAEGKKIGEFRAYCYVDRTTI